MARRKRNGQNSLFRQNQGYRPGRSVFDLSYTHMTTGTYGRLYPTYIQEVYPGDHFEIGCTTVVRQQPTVVPIMDNITLTHHLFFVPFRLLDEYWEKFITRGEDGMYVSMTPAWQRMTKPTDQTDIDYWRPILGYDVPYYDSDIGTLIDHMGFPVRQPWNAFKPGGDNYSFLSDYPRRAYIKIWNDYYRDENLIDAIPMTANDAPTPAEYRIMCWILPRAWHKDYFTSALPWQQRGPAPAIPLTGTASAVWPDACFDLDGSATANFNVQAQRNSNVGPLPLKAKITTTSASEVSDIKQFQNTLNYNTIDLNNLGTFNIVDLRVAYSVQRFQELQARGGARYTETVMSQFGVHNRDYRLQRAEYIGGMKMPIVISEVVQTSGEIGDTPQGNLAGHGLGVSGNYCGKYSATEHGVILGLTSIMPTSGYQQGIPREWSRQSSYDYYWPILAELSEQGILMQELYNPYFEEFEDYRGVFGFQGCFDEMRARQNVVTSQMRYYDPEDYKGAYTQPPEGRRVPPSLNYWNKMRYFATAPRLNWEFMLCRPRLDDLVVQDEPPFLINMRHSVKAVRPLPYRNIPGWS